ncbi:hypothetical protein ACTFIV_002779 [Dictyostelium citrinum]
MNSSHRLEGMMRLELDMVILKTMYRIFPFDCYNFLKLHWILMGRNFWCIFFAVEHFLRKVETYSPPGTLQGASPTQKTSTREVPTLRAQLARRVGTGIH